MPDDRSTYASEREITELWSEIRHLREELAKREAPPPQNGNGKPKSDEDSNQKEKQDTGQKREEEKPETPPKSHRLRNMLVLVGAILLLTAGVLWWLHARHFENTDDAQIDGHVSGVAARISAVVTAVYVEENQPVKAGQLLVDLDCRDYQTSAQQTAGQLSQAQAQTQAEQPNVPVTQVTNRTNISTAASDVANAQAAVAGAQRDYEAALAKVREAQANNAKAQADVDRYRPLAEKDEVPHEQFDQVVATAKALAATVESNQASAAASLQQVEQRKAQLAQAVQRQTEAEQNAPQQLAIQRANVATRQAAVASARAQHNQAVLNTSYCRITSPVDGIVAKRNAEIGQHVTPGQEVALVSQTAGLWVTANFRETQLRRMHPGQPVTIHVDSLGLDFRGSVENMPAATGAITSLLPPENATGNYVKVVQRLPVRIHIDPNQEGLDRLRPGMSVEPKVRVL
jgi:membrane fusion protein (multidrug efflux system)